MKDYEYLKDYLKSLDCSSIDGFRKLFYESSDAQLNLINERYEAASEELKFLYYDDGVEACFIRELGNELVLIALYHNFEVKIKQIIRLNASARSIDIEENKLHRWDNIKAYIPEKIKESRDFQQINVLRLLVNCFKHSGVVSQDLYSADTSFGNVDDEINADLYNLYERYKKYASSVIEATAEQLLFKTGELFK